MFYVYIVKSLKSGRNYIGQTNDLERRLEDHNRGKNRSVRGRGPFQLIYKEGFSNRLDAIRRERELKSYKKGMALKRLIATNREIVDPIV